MLAIRTRLTALICVLPFLGFAQKHEHHGDLPTYSHPIMQRDAIQWYGGFKVEDDAVKEITTHLYAKHTEWVGSTIVSEDIITSPQATYYHFSQFVGGQRIFGTDAVVQVDNSGTVRFITSNFYPTNSVDGHPLMENGNPISANDFLTEPQRGVWFYNGQKLVPAIRQVYQDHSNFREFITDANGVIIWERDLNLYNDTTVNVKVFDPDPLTSLRVTYGAPYVDGGDGNTNNLDPERVDRTVTATYQNGTFSLTNSYVNIRDFDSPTFAPATESSPNFIYSRSDNRFEQVNAFYHLTAYQLYMQSIGFNLVNYRIDVDANGWSGADQSSFSRGTNPPSLRFGEGGVDDAEDADVILHEYGHAMSHSASPNSNMGTERGCLDEAFGDYVAASYSRGVDSYGYARVFSWDGHNEFWPGRMASNTNNKNYQQLSFFSLYTHTDIWSSALMEIWGKIGKEKTDKVVYEGAHGFASNMTMPQAAMLIVSADSIHHGGANVQPIWEAFVNHGILPANDISTGENDLDSDVLFYNIYEFARGGELQVSLNVNRKYAYRLIDMTGRIISNGSIDDRTSRWTYSSAGLRSGAYVVMLTDDQGNVYHQKVTRLR